MGLILEVLSIMSFSDVNFPSFTIVLRKPLRFKKYPGQANARSLSRFAVQMRPNSVSCFLT